MLRIVISSDDRVRHYPLTKAAVLAIGSSSDNQIVIRARGVSRHHARIERRDGEAVITDLGSKNGLVASGKRLARAVLRPGASVHIGMAVLRLEEISTSDAELALRLDEGSSSDAHAQGDTDSEVLSLRPTAADALKWARDAEHVPVTDLLERAREIVGAAALVFSKEDVITHLAGVVPVDVNLERGGHAAALDSDGSPTQLEAWQREFLDYVHQRLHEDERSDRVAPPRERDLVLPPGTIPGRSRAMRDLFVRIEQVAPGTVNVLITGETGTGKEIVARTIHGSGPTANGRFVAVNCAAIASELLEAELFGIKRAVATGVEPRHGLFVEADGGTIFLDEISEMPEKLQAKLLRALQEREVLPVGGTKPQRVNVRVIASTNQDIEKLVTEHRFRPDLFYRLRGAHIRVPALREHPEDIPHLVLGFTARAASRARKNITGVTRRALAVLVAHTWPGNVRELEQVIERAVLVCPSGAAVGEGDLDLASFPSSGGAAAALDEIEERAITKALETTGGNKTAAARILGITRQGLYNKLRRRREE